MSEKETEQGYPHAQYLGLGSFRHGHGGVPPGGDSRATILPKGRSGSGGADREDEKTDISRNRQMTTFLGIATTAKAS